MAEEDEESRAIEMQLEEMHESFESFDEKPVVPKLEGVADSSLVITVSQIKREADEDVSPKIKKGLSSS